MNQNQETDSVNPGNSKWHAKWKLDAAEIANAQEGVDETKRTGTGAKWKNSNGKYKLSAEDIANAEGGREAGQLEGGL
ncbi:hypothetical protein M408DRAFT_29812 [Serendipita vermifera MAFF 305830]|uniref:Uncharacterized protein n=1 Tax=Serendipita vermifera MAFF 305830 TaxID=933852 RepID=A0A0C2WUP3_SERVB|nr:hypothetical protein M408DRAFT_29812 [Serendipita vermifera MAFF 305830]